MKGQPWNSRRAFALWFMSGTVVTVIHAAALMALLPDPEIFAAEEPAAIVIEFAETPASAANQPQVMAAGPEQVEAKAVPDTANDAAEEKARKEKPVEKANNDQKPEMPPALAPEVPVEEKKLNEEQPKPMAARSQAAALMTSAPQVLSEKISAVAAAPQQGSLSRNDSSSLPRWTSRISTLLERNKRYPKAAREHRESGVVQVSFTIDREGRLLSSNVKKSSGHGLLDEEAIAILKRAQPFPPVPAEVPGQTISMTIPIRFDGS
jgi:protein TonB